ncbi:MAG: hypothetical protein HW389_765 [Bacteroidetes bacterium]|nr:hypothetical protein [Bacteroidota bacterium]
MKLPRCKIGPMNSGLLFQASARNPMWNRDVTPAEVCAALEDLAWKADEHVRFLDDTFTRAKDLRAASEVAEQRLSELSASLKIHGQSEHQTYVIVHAVGEFSFRYLTRYLPVLAEIGSLNIYDLPHPGQLVPFCSGGLENDNEMLHGHAWSILFDKFYQWWEGDGFDRYFRMVQKHDPETQRRLIARRLPRAVRALAWEILCSGHEHAEAYYRLMDVSAIRQVPRIQHSYRSPPPIRAHPNTYDLIASDICQHWNGFHDLLRLFPP